MPDAGVAILAKAPVPGYAKTRLIPRLGPEGTAAFAGRLVAHAVEKALAAGISPVTLWCAPDPDHPLFQALGRRGVRLATQPKGDIGRRMLASFEAAQQPLVLIGTDCPTLRPSDLVDAALALEASADAAIAPAEDGGYGLIAAARPLPCLFREVPWSTDLVMAATRARAAEHGLILAELRTVWDVDTPIDWDRLACTTPELAFGSASREARAVLPTTMWPTRNTPN